MFKSYRAALLRIAGLCAAGLVAVPASAATSTSFCNASGEVEVLSEKSGVQCVAEAGTVTPRQEIKALIKARRKYQRLDWQIRERITTRIDRRIRALNKQIRSGS